MTEALKYLVVEEAFRHQLAASMSAAEKSSILSDTAFLLGFDGDGNIRVINETELGENTCHELSYLTGSLNFLFDLISTRIQEEEGPPEKLDEYLLYRKKVVRLMIDLLLGLSAIQSDADAATVCSEVYHRKMQVRNLLLQKQP
jgi:hypothetical protein